MIPTALDNFPVAKFWLRALRRPALELDRVRGLESHLPPLPIAIEYELGPSAYCAKAASLGLTAIRKKLGLGAWRVACP